MLQAATAYFEPHALTLSELLEGTVYRIPEYQRSYAWSIQGDRKEPGEFETLWTDIIRTIDNNFNNFNLIDPQIQKPHFIGAIVTEMPPNPLVKHQYVIDGQQRLITLTILFTVLSDFIKEVNDVSKREDLFNSVQVLIKKYGSGTAVGYNPRITLNDNDDQMFYEEHVLKPVSSDKRLNNLPDEKHLEDLSKAQRNISECIKFFSAKIREFLGQSTDANYDSKTECLTITLLTLIIALHVKVQKPGMAYVIFETLNKRGLNLTQADLIKNEVFRRAHSISSNQHETVVKLWFSMQDDLPPNQDDAATSFVRFHYASTKAVVQSKTLYDTISNYLKGTSVVDYAKSLREEAPNYTTLVDASISEDITRDHLRQINEKLNVKMSYILLLAGAKVFGISSPEFAKLAKLTRDFCFRFMTVGDGSVAKIEDVMVKAALSVRSDKNLDEVINLFNTNSPDGVFEERFTTFQAKQPVIAFYIIREIEIYKAANTGALIPFDRSPTQHLEHIMPKSKENEGWDHLKNDERYNSYLNRIGNHLVLEREINSSIKHSSFEDKSGISGVLTKNYTTSKLQLPHEVSGYLVNGKWTFESIHKRQAALAKIALNVWSLK